MERNVFITDIDTSLGADLSRLYLKEGFGVFGTGTTEEGLSRITSETGPDAETSLVTGIWRRASPISARNMVLKAQNSFDDLNNFIVIGNPIPSSSGFDDFKVDALDRDIDNWVKGNLFLLRDILAFCLNRKEARISLICLHHGGESPISDVIRRGFSGLARSLLRIYDEGAFSIQVFESVANLSNEFALYIFRTLTERGERAAGKWLRYQKGLFSTLKKAGD